MIENTYDVDLKMDDDAMRANLKSGGLLFGSLHKEAEDLKSEFMHLIFEGVVDKRKNEVKRILVNATKDLKKLRAKKSIKKGNLKKR
jgi:hypothetical protein